MEQHSWVKMNELGTETRSSSPAKCKIIEHDSRSRSKFIISKTVKNTTINLDTFTDADNEQQGNQYQKIKFDLT